MAWLSVDKDGSESIFKLKPERDEYGYWSDEDWRFNIADSEIEIPKGTIEKLIGRTLTFEDEPIEIK